MNQAAPRDGDAAVTLVDHFWRQVNTRPEAPALYFRVGERWAPITWGQFGAASRRLAALLLAEGVESGDHVAIWASNRPEWHIADAAVLSVRARPVPVYLTLSADQAGYVLEHSQARVAFVENPAILEQVLSVRDRLSELRRVVVISGLEQPSGDGFVIPWDLALTRGASELAARAAALDERIASVDAADVATLIYTSGTTGPPKAVKLTHANVAAAAAATAPMVGGDENDRILSYLPLAHIAERMNSEFRQYRYGNPTWFAVSVDRLGEHLSDVRPTLFFAVPRVWEKMAARIRGVVEAGTGVQGRVARSAVAVGAQVAATRDAGRRPSMVLALRYRVADRLVLRRLRMALGLDQARILASGAAPIAPDVLRFFAAIGMPILEVYGQTEDTGLTTMNRPGQMRIGTVGTPVDGVEMRLAEDGEILVRGDVVFPGYHRDEAATAEALEGGWLHTGDVGEIDPDGSLRITDRKKDLIITAGGKNIAPSNIEAALKRHPLISHAVAIGDRRPYVSGLVTLDPQEAVAFARRRGLATADPGALVHSPEVIAEIQRHIDEVNASLSHVEQIKRWALLENDFTIGDELTPTLKVKRKVVLEKHHAAIESNYTAT